MAEIPFNAQQTASNNGATANSVAQASGIQAIENPLGTVAQPSFHWKFYIGNDMGTSVASKVVIAETGNSGFNITDVEVEAIAGPNFQDHNMGSGQRFIIKITEPLGMALPDKMIQGAQFAGVSNFMKCPYFISVDFLGYDPESGAPVKPTGLTWIWKLFITKLTTDFDTTGGKHTIEAIGYDQIAQLNQFAVFNVPWNIDVSKKESKVGDVFRELERLINENIDKQYDVAHGGIAPYRIQFKDIPYKNGGAVSRPFDHKIVRDKKYLDSSRAQGGAQISRGTDVGRLVDYIMSASETATAMANPADSATQNDAESKEYTTTHRVETEIVNTGYDAKSQEYIRLITFWIKAHDSVRPMISAKSYDDAIGNGKKKLDFANSNNYLKKEYNYIFTGLNTEVLDFNISLNFMFNVASALYKGYITSENASVGIQHDPENFDKQSLNRNWEQNSDGTVPINFIGPPMPSSNNQNGMSFSPNQATAASNGSILVEDLTPGPSVLPVSFIQDGVDPRYSVNMAVEASNVRTRSIYGTILNQLYGVQDQNLQVIDMTIRGDPYWLGATNVESINTQSTDEKPNFANGEHMFLLKLFLPKGIKEDGSPDLQFTDMYSGFYATTKVISKFNNGQFTQVLSAIRIPSMQPTKLLGGQ